MAAALQNRVLVIGPQPQHAGAGALIGYGTSPRDNYRRSAVYVKKVLAGTKPADLPVEQPVLLPLWVNVKTIGAAAGGPARFLVSSMSVRRERRTS